MLVSYNWLQEFIDIQVDADELGRKLTMVGLAVDALEARDGDTVFDLDISSNRGDCLSHLGVAREACAALDVDVRRPEFQIEEVDRAADEAFSISIADPDLCGRYCGRYIEGVQVGPSPDWMVRKLESVGIRSINNVADITNYVLMELGHPLHAFDADTLEGGEIIVRRAELDETIQTLDGEKRELDPSMLVIADSNRAVALAGVMGGVDTEISTSTTNVLLESAWFDPLTTRKTARALNLSTEASYRFERGADIEMALHACDRTATLIHELAGGKVYRGVIDVYPGREESSRASLRRRRILEYLGMEVPEQEVVRVLTRLEFEPVENDEEGWSVRVPTHRHDISSEEDLMEEIARHHGYDRFPSTLPVWAGQGSALPWTSEERIVRETLSGLGYSEACTIPFSSEEMERGFAPDLDPVVILNPLSEEAPVLRTSMVPSILRSLLWNLNRGTRDVGLYEIGKIYPTDGESQQLVLGATGALQAKTVHHNQTELEFFRLKGDVEALLAGFAVDKTPDASTLPAYYHPGRAIRLGEVAVLGELHQDQTNLFKLRQKVYVAEIQIEELYASGRTEIAARAIPKYPSIRRDLSLIINRKTDYSAVVRTIYGEDIDELIEIEPFDRLEQGPFPDDCYSLAIKLIYQSASRTLTDDQVQDFDRRILARLETELGARLRS